MMKKILATFLTTAALCLSICLVGCGGSSDGKGVLDASGYQGELEDGYSIVYIQLGEDTAMVSFTDGDHQGDDAETYTGKFVTDEDGKTTVTDDESGKTITLTFTENADGTTAVEAEGHGKGELKAYEGNILKMIASMAEDDESADE